MRFNYEVQHTAGKNLVTADMLSRAPLNVPEEADSMLENEPELFINSIIASFPATNQCINEIRQKSDLTIQLGLLLFNNRLVNPRLLGTDILNHLHVGHQGIVKCHALAQTSVWWPRISSDLKTKVEKCHICVKEYQQKPEPLIPSKMPDYPWQL